MGYLSSVIKQFLYYKSLGEKAMQQVEEQDLFKVFSKESNSIAIIVKHLHGNMLSRWTDFLTTDGEKPSRRRDEEFINDINTREALLQLWNEGWKCLMDTLESLQEKDLESIIYIRNEGHTVMEAINRQLAHYPYHIGQIVFIAKLSNDHFTSLSIPRNNSNQYNADKFGQEKGVRHFTDSILKDDAKKRK